MCKPQVIAISGASGAGKTTIVKQLAKTLNCQYLLFDQYIDTNTYPSDMKSWLNKGANVSLIKTPRLVTALQRCLLENHGDFIFIEEPFGKQRNSMSAFIDHVVLLDTPLTTCLTRIEARYTGNYDSFALFKIKYDDYFKEIYSAAVKQVRNNSDLIINDVSSISTITNLIVNWLKKDNCSNQG